MLQNLTLDSPNVGGFVPHVQYPGDNCCHLFEDMHYGQSENGGNKKLTLCHDNDRAEFRLKDYQFNDTVESWYCGKNVWYNFCAHDDPNNCSWPDNNIGSGAGHQRNANLHPKDN